MIDARLYLLQRLTAIAMLPLIATHLILMIFAINGGLTAEEILGQHELVTVHIAPIEYEIAWEKFHEKQTKH